MNNSYQYIKEVILGGGLVAPEKVEHLTLTPLTELLHPTKEEVQILNTYSL
jgi:hypothetical protein